MKTLIIFACFVFQPLCSLEMILRKINDDFETTYIHENWHPRETGLIVCDMWDRHHSLNATKRVQKLAPEINVVLEKARKQGIFIIHAPSDCMKFYESHSARKLAINTPKAKNTPKRIDQWCLKLLSEVDAIYPLDETDCNDDEPIENAFWVENLKSEGRNPSKPWKRQISEISIDKRDAISDSGKEIWNLLEKRKIKNVVLLGVHVNMCIAGRPFGLRQMAKNGKNVVLMRDMTDSMYNPAKWPYVDHDTGTELFISYIEKYICPTITSDQI
jgi:nicotinamidase-related amidase